MIKFVKAHFSLFVLNAIAAIVYITVFLNLNTGISYDIAYSSPDALTYLDVANWLGSGVDHKSISIRPVLFPLILLIATKVGGAYGIWLLQVLFWFATLNFTFLAIRHLAKSSLFAALGPLIIASNLSLITLTLHALTELTTVFLLSAMLLFLVRRMEQYREPRFFHTGLFFLVLLSIVKPVFSIPVFGLLLVVFPLFYLRAYMKSPKHLLRLALILLPLLVQLSIIKTKYDEFKVSLISSVTFTEYFVAQGMQVVGAISRDDAVEMAASYSSEQQLDFVYEHLSTYSGLFTKNIASNVTGISTFLLYPPGYEHYGFAEYMDTYNETTLTLHCVFLVLVIALFLMLYRKKNYPKLTVLLFLYGLGAYYIVVTGISFMQGDRLTLPAIAIWACLYPVALHFCWKEGYAYLRLKREPKLA